MSHEKLVPSLPFREFGAVVGCFLRNCNVMGVAFSHTRCGDLDESRFRPQFFDRSGAAISHACPKPSDELIHEYLFPVWLKFKGGKGVATFFGTLLAAAWPVGMAAGATWLVVAFLFRISSLAGLSAVALAPIYALVFDLPLPIAWLTLFMAVLVFIRHADNIRRLLKGQEPKIGAKEEDAA